MAVPILRPLLMVATVLLGLFGGPIMPLSQMLLKQGIDKASDAVSKEVAKLAVAEAEKAMASFHAHFDVLCWPGAAALDGRAETLALDDSTVQWKMVTAHSGY